MSELGIFVIIRDCAYGFDEPKNMKAAVTTRSALNLFGVSGQLRERSTIVSRRIIIIRKDSAD